MIKVSVYTSAQRHGKNSPSARSTTLYFRWRVPGKKPTYETAPTTDMDEALALVPGFEAEVNGLATSTAPSRSKGPRFRNFVSELEKDLVARQNRKPTTIQGIPMLLRSEPIDSFFGDLGMEEITKDVLVRWAKNRDRETKKGFNGTMCNQFTALSKLFKLYAKEKDGFTSPVLDARREAMAALRDDPNSIERAEEEEEVKVIEAKTLGKLIEVATAHRDPEAQVAVLLGCDAGLRLGEIRALTWGQVDLDGRMLTINRSIAKSVAEVSATKSGRKRYVEVSKRLAQALRQLHLAQGRPDGRECVLPGYFSKPDRLPRRMRQLSRHLPESVRTKDLRSTFATYLARANFPPSYVQQQLGHADVTTTDRHYLGTYGIRYVAAVELAEDEVPADVIARATTEARKKAAEGDAR